MSFELGNEKKSDRGNNAVDYQTWALHAEPAESKTSKFMTLSAIIHAGILIAVGMMAVPLIEEAKVETITIEIAEPPPVHRMSKGEQTPITRGALPEKIVKEDLTPITKDDVVVAKATPKQLRAAKLAEAKAAKAEARMAKAAARAEAKAAKVAAAHAKQAARQMTKSTARAKPIAVAHAVKAAPAAAPKLATIDDIDAPEIDKVAEEAQHAWEPAAFNDDMDDDLEKVNNKQSKLLAAEKSKLDLDADKLDADNEQALNEAASSNQEELAAIAAANEARRARDAQAIAAASANEKAAQQAAAQAAQQQAAREAAAQAAAEASAAAAAREAAGREAARQRLAAAAAAKAAAGQGAGANGSPEQGRMAGAPNGVRTLDQLRQKPGNPIPQYASEERLRRQQGQVTFVAYVNKDGSMGKFKQVTSTGYQNLDAKTLQALQQWKFYPGQEGWVELPFRWDLKGGAQSIDGLLRTKRSDISRM